MMPSPQVVKDLAEALLRLFPSLLTPELRTSKLTLSSLETYLPFHNTISRVPITTIG